MSLSTKCPLRDVWDDCRHRSSMLSAVEVNTNALGEIISEREISPPPACIYGESYPEKFIDMPRWITNDVFAGGPGFQPHKHCVKCPAYEVATVDKPSHDADKRRSTPPDDLADLFNL